MTTMRQTYAVIALLGLLLSACSERGENVYRTWIGPDRSNMAIVTLRLGEDVRDVTIRERVLPRSEYGTVLLAPGKYTLYEEDGASVGINIRPAIVSLERARANGELILGHTYVLRGGKSKQSGKRALWIEDARSGDVFVDGR
jgi:hypothetical protein